MKMKKLLESSGLTIYQEMEQWMNWNLGREPKRWFNHKAVREPKATIALKEISRLADKYTNPDELASLRNNAKDLKTRMGVLNASTLVAEADKVIAKINTKLGQPTPASQPSASQYNASQSSSTVNYFEGYFKDLYDYFKEFMKVYIPKGVGMLDKATYFLETAINKGACFYGILNCFKFFKETYENKWVAMNTDPFARQVWSFAPDVFNYVMSLNKGTLKQDPQDIKDHLSLYAEQMALQLTWLVAMNCAVVIYISRTVVKNYSGNADTSVTFDDAGFWLGTECTYSLAHSEIDELGVFDAGKAGYFLKHSIAELKDFTNAKFIIRYHKSETGETKYKSVKLSDLVTILDSIGVSKYVK